MSIYTAPDAQLYYAVIYNDLEKLQNIINEGRCVDEFYFDDQNISTKSLLHVACEKGRYDCVKLLIENNATLDVRDKWGQSPLRYAISAGHADVAGLMLLIDRELSNDSDSFGKSALHSAAERGFLEGIQILLKHGANIDKQSVDGITAVSRAICARDLENCTDTVKSLIEGGADVNIKDRVHKRSALQNAAITKKVKVVELLLQAGADPNSLDGAGRTALTNIMCLHVTNVEGVSIISDDVMTIIVMLIQAGADVNLNICEYCNPLMTAAYIKAEPLIRFFLSHGADPDISSKQGVTSLLISTSKNDILSVKTFLEWNTRTDIPGLIYKKHEDRNYTMDPYELAIAEGHFDLAKVLISAGYSKYRKPYLFGKAPLPQPLVHNPIMKLWLVQKAASVDTLFKLVLVFLRTLLGRNVKLSVKALPLPSTMKGSIVLSGLLNTQDGY